MAKESQLKTDKHQKQSLYTNMTKDFNIDVAEQKTSTIVCMIFYHIDKELMASPTNNISHVLL